MKITLKKIKKSKIRSRKNNRIKEKDINKEKNSKYS